MKHLKHIKLTNESAQEEDEPEIKTPSIEDYPQSVKLIYKRFNLIILVFQSKCS